MCMQLRRALGAIIIMCVVPLPAFADDSQASLTVEVGKLPGDGATATVILFGDSKTFDLSVAKAERKNWKGHHAVIDVKSQAGTATATFKNLAAGDYAVFVFCDVNNNGKLDTKFPGIPAEPIGTSNNIIPPKQRPTWENTKVRLVPGKNEIGIDVVTVSR